MPLNLAADVAFPAHEQCQEQGQEVPLEGATTVLIMMRNAGDRVRSRVLLQGWVPCVALSHGEEGRLPCRSWVEDAAANGHEQSGGRDGDHTEASTEVPPHVKLRAAPLKRPLFDQSRQPKLAPCSLFDQVFQTRFVIVLSTAKVLLTSRPAGAKDCRTTRSRARATEEETRGLCVGSRRGHHADRLRPGRVLQSTPHTSTPAEGPRFPKGTWTLVARAAPAPPQAAPAPASWRVLSPQLAQALARYGTSPSY